MTRIIALSLVVAVHPGDLGQLSKEGTMEIFSGVIGLFALVGAAAILRWSFGGTADDRPRMDLLFERIRARRGGMNREGAEGARAALYPDPERHACRHCDALVLGAHDCPKRPADSFDEAFKRAQGKLAPVRSIRRAS